MRAGVLSASTSTGRRSSGKCNSRGHAKAAERSRTAERIRTQNRGHDDNRAPRGSDHDLAGLAEQLGRG